MYEAVKNKKMVQKLKKLFQPKILKKKVFYSAFVVVAVTGLIFANFFGGGRVAAAQFGRPIADITTAGFAPTPLYSALNETSPDGTASEVTSTNNGGNQTVEVKLGPVTDPLSSTGHIISVYVKKTSSRSSAMVFSLVQGTTVLASSGSTTLTTTYTQYDYTLSGAEANSISDYTDLRIRVVFTDNAGGPPGTWNWSWAQLQVPDPPNFTQFGYRWRNDDGNETTGSSLASENTAGIIATNTNVRVRFSIKNTGGSESYSYRLEYTTAPGGVCSNTSWTTVPDVPTTEAFDMVSTANYTDQAASTNAASGPGVLTDPGGSSFTAGKLVESTSNTASSVTVGQNQFTELEYALQANSNASQPTYCFRVTNVGAVLDSYSQYALLNVSFPPQAPVIYSPLNGATSLSVTPMFELRGVDPNNDYLRYNIEECPTNSWPCGGGGHTYDETSSQTCYSGQDVQSATAYQANLSEYNSSMAYCTMPSTDFLNINTTYYFRARAIDPGGSNSFGPYTSTFSFTTGNLEVLIRGGTNIKGGTIIGNYSFPSNSVLDNFNRAGTNNPPSANWAIDGTHSCGLKLAGDSATVAGNTAATFCGDYWNPTQFGRQTEVFAKVTTLPSATQEAVSFYGRIQNPTSGSTLSAYEVEFDNNASGTNAIQFFRYTNNVFSTLTGSPQSLPNAMSAGDSFGMTISGSATVTITAWYKPVNGSWTSVGSVTDSSANRVTTAGFIGIEMFGTASRVDDYGGGTY